MVRRSFTRRDFRPAPNFERFEVSISALKKFYETGLSQIEAVLENENAPLTQWNERRVQSIRVQIKETLQQMNDSVPELADSLVAASYDDGLRVLPPGNKPAFNAVHTQKVATIANEMKRNLTDGIAEIGRWVDDGLRQAQLEAAIAGQVQGLSQRNQEQRLRDFISKDNLRMPRGYRGNAGGYVEMVTRTNLAEANRSAKRNRALELDISLVLIRGHGATDTCGPWEDTVISLLPNDDGIPTYDEVRAMRSTHIFGPNCRHETLVPVTSRLVDELRQKEGIENAGAALKMFEKKERRR